MTWVAALLLARGQTVPGAESRAALARRANVPAGWAQDPRVLLAAVLLSELLSAMCIARLWQDPRVTTRTKLTWTAVLLVPFVGPLVYGIAR